MLVRSDTEVVKAWITSALELGKKRGQTAAGLAVACSVTAQAVNGWKTTGRISKKHLAVAASFFGHGPSFTSSAHGVAEPSASYGAAAWPFKRISAERFNGLGAAQRDRVEIYAEGVLAEWEAAQTAANKRKRGAA